MKCIACNSELNIGDVYCSKCGTKIELPKEPPKIPQMMTVKEAAILFFQNKVSSGLLYAMVRGNRIPHTRMSNGKVLFDIRELSEWWTEEQRKSVLNAKISNRLREVEPELNKLHAATKNFDNELKDKALKMGFSNTELKVMGLK